MELKPLEVAVLQPEYDAIMQAIEKAKGNKSRAAKLLKIDRKTLYNKIWKYEKAAKNKLLS